MGGRHFSGLLSGSLFMHHFWLTSEELLDCSVLGLAAGCLGPALSPQRPRWERACKSTIFQTVLDWIASWNLPKLGFCRLPNLFC